MTNTSIPRATGIICLGSATFKFILVTVVLGMSHRAEAQFFKSNTHLHAFGGGIYADISYQSEGMTNPGTAGLRVYAPGDSFATFLRKNSESAGVFSQVSRGTRPVGVNAPLYG